MIRPSPPATASLLVDCTGAGGINCGRCCHDKCLFFSQKTRSIWVDLVILNHVSSNGLFYGTCKREWLWTLRFYGTSTLWAMTFFSWRTLAIEGSINSDYSFSRKIGLVIRQFASSYDKLLILSSSPGSYYQNTNIAVHEKDIFVYVFNPLVITKFIHNFSYA